LCYYAFVNDTREDRETQEGKMLFGKMNTDPPNRVVVGGVEVLKDAPRPKQMQQGIYWDILHATVGGRYNLVSAIHKEIRRCDVERGMALGHLFGRVYGFPRLKAYIKNIILEETRDRALSEFMASRQDAAGVMVALLWMIRTKKKWHLPTRHAAYKVGYTKDMIFGAKPIAPDVAAQMLRDALKNGDPEAGYSALWGRVVASAEGDSSGLSCLTKVVSEVFPEEPILQGYHGIQTAIELSLHPETWSAGSMSQAPQLNYTEPDEYPEFRRYVFDRHTVTGMKWIKSTLPALLEVRGDSKVVDLRWSGVTMGCVWREVAGQKFSPDDMRSLTWADAGVPVPLWEMAVHLDKMTEPKIFGPWEGK
jgi:hypothetical protein